MEDQSQSDQIRNLATKQDDESDAKGRANSFENYNVEDAIKVVRSLGSRLIDASKSTNQHVKHHFRQEWIDQLIARYRERPGKPILHDLIRKEAHTL
jgi:hypothetical protein